MAEPATPSAPVPTGVSAPVRTGVPAPVRARVIVTLKPGVLDPQGQAIEQALGGLGHEGVASVRQGKVFEIALEDGADAEARLGAMCEALLANTVIERYRIELIAPTGAEREGAGQ